MPSIMQFRKIVKDIEYLAGDSELPKLKAKGTVKLHGTNASILYNLVNKSLVAQKKSGIIYPNCDNFGFAQFLEDNRKIITQFVESIVSNYLLEYKNIEYLTVFGEWAGKGIQKQVAISTLDKTFYIFGLHIKYLDKTESWLKTNILEKIYPPLPLRNVYNFKTYDIDIDFNDIKSSIQKMNCLMLSVEEKDPIAEELGTIGIGEGIVFIIDNWKNTRFIWKIKGNKHSSNPKKIISHLLPIDPEKESLLNSILPDWRLNQGITEIYGENPIIDRSLFGEYVKWINSDIIKEELDIIESSKYEIKDLNKDINRRAITFIKQKI